MKGDSASTALPLGNSPDLVQEWLEGQCAGTLHSQGSFTIDPLGAERQGIAGLRLSDVPLLLLAGAVEGGSRFFRVHLQRDLRLSWEGELGPTAAVALSLLRGQGVDARIGASSLDLPPFFEELLEPLSRRCRHAPLQLIWNNRVVSSGKHGNGEMLLSRRREPRLLLVDRGIDFALDGGFKGLSVVAWVGPLAGAPWPRRLLPSPGLAKHLSRIARALASAGLASGSSRPAL